MGIRKPFKLPGKPNWYIEVNRKRRSTGTADHREAMAVYRGILRKQDVEEAQSSAVTVQAFAEQYLKWTEVYHEAATQKQARQSISKMSKYVGVLNLQEVDSQAVDRIVAGMLSEGLCRSSVNAHLRKLKAAFRKSVEWFGAPVLKIRLLKEERRPPAVMGREQIVALLNKLGGKTGNLIKAYLYSGRRRCELLGLEWKDIDLEGRRYFVHQKKVHLSQWFPIGHDFHRLLSSLPGREGKVFAGLTPNSATQVVKRTLRRHGVDHLRLHDLRHTYAACYLEAGGDIFALKELLGHRQIQTTMIYAHLSQDKLQAEADRVTFE